MEFIRRNSGYLIALLGLGAFLYIFNLHNPLFWDDADWILNNPSVHAFSWTNIQFIFTHNVLAGIGLVSNYYRPFLFLTFLANYAVSGASPAAYHILNNSIHILNGLLIFFLLSRWLDNRRAAFLAALLFLIHPLQTEAVTYISGRGDPLSIFFVLAGMAAFFHLRQRRIWAAYVISGICMVLAILSRETAVLFPGYLGIGLMAFEYRDHFLARFKKAFVAVLPFAAIGGIYGLLRLTVLNFQNTLNFYQQQNIYSEHITYRIYTFFHALLVYLRLALFPVALHMERDIAVNIHLFEGVAWLGALVILGMLGWLFIAYRFPGRKQFNVWFFGLGIFFLNLLPTSGLVPINARIYEHWLYFSLFGFFTVAAWHIDRLLAYAERRRASLKPAIIVLLVIYAAFLSIQTIRRNLLWGDTERFYQNILFYEPQNVRILNNLGNWYSEHEKNQEALELYRRAIAADPTQPAPYYNVGNIEQEQGDLAAAETSYKKAISIDPNFHYAYGNLASLYVRQNRLTEALAVLRELEKIFPSPETEKNIKMLEEAMK